MYLLDTNICIYLINNKYPDLYERIQKEKPFTVAISSVTLAELEYGIAKSLYPERNRFALLNFLSVVEIVDFTAHDCRAFGEIRAGLFKRGLPIGPYDMMIAAQCKAGGHSLVTNNVKEFERFPGISIENWVQEK